VTPDSRLLTTDFRALLDFHYWARDRLLEALEPLTTEQYTRDLGSSFKSIRDTLAHTYSAEWVWYSRWQGTSAAGHLPPERFPDVATIRSEWTAHEARMRAFLDRVGDDGLNRVIGYRMFDGTEAATPLWQMLQHVVNHASYHRGQITTLLRQLGAKPPQSMDLIAYYRGLARRPQG
jgi:uncharacterized damage-inducible protein DinB